MQLRKTCNHPNLVEEKQVKSALQFPRLTLVLPKRLFLRPKADGLPFGCHFGYDPSYEKNTISGFSQFDYEFLVKNRPSKGRINNMLMINHHSKEKQLNMMNFDYKYMQHIQHEIHLLQNFVGNNHK
jgi:hypothetical protein